jgi:hypothetical protein
MTALPHLLTLNRLHPLHVEESRVIAALHSEPELALNITTVITSHCNSLCWLESIKLLATQYVLLTHSSWVGKTHAINFFTPDCGKLPAAIIAVRDI